MNNQEMANKPEVVADIEKGQTSELAQQKLRSVQFMAEFSSPLPPPKILEGYNAIIPDAGEKILKMAVDQGNHRRSVEMKVVDAQIEIQKRGQMFAFGIAIVGLGCSVGCAYLQQPWVASIIGGGTLLGMISIFIRGKVEQEKELNQKRTELPPSPVGKSTK